MCHFNKSIPCAAATSTRIRFQIYDGPTARKSQAKLCYYFYMCPYAVWPYSTLYRIACYCFFSLSHDLHFSRWLKQALVFTVVILFVARLFVMSLVYILPTMILLQLPSMHVFFHIHSFIAVECHRFFVLLRKCIPLGVMNESVTKAEQQKQTNNNNLRKKESQIHYLFIFVHCASRIRSWQYDATRTKWATLAYACTANTVQTRFTNNIKACEIERDQCRYENRKTTRKFIDLHKNQINLWVCRHQNPNK